MDCSVIVLDMNHCVRSPEMIATFRKLSLGGSSGMNRELNRFLKNSTFNRVNAKAVIARNEEFGLVGWALLSKEKTQEIVEFEPEDGYLVYIFVAEGFRRQGVGSQLLEKCQLLAGKEYLNVCPWSEEASGFYYKKNNHMQFNNALVE